MLSELPNGNMTGVEFNNRNNQQQYYIAGYEISNSIYRETVRPVTEMEPKPETTECKIG
jgi:hypothetical protein